MPVPKIIALYWRCWTCGTYHQLMPKARPKRYCDRRCQAKAYYKRKKIKELTDATN